MNNDLLTNSVSIQVSERGEARRVPHVSTFRVSNNQILTLVNVGSESVAQHDEQQESHLNATLNSRPFRALWDTGAVRTLIEPEVIRELNLSPEGGMTMRGVDGIVSEIETYRILLIITRNPDSPTFPHVMTLHPVVAGKLERDGQLGGQFEVLIGMDIIQKLDFAISRGVDGHVWCSIRHPASGYRVNFDGIE